MNNCSCLRVDSYETKRRPLGIDAVDNFDGETKSWSNQNMDISTPENVVVASSAAEPFPVIRMLLSDDSDNTEHPTVKLADNQLLHFNPFKELYFSTHSQEQPQRLSNTGTNQHRNTCENNPTYEIIPYTPEKDIKNNLFCLQSTLLSNVANNKEDTTTVDWQEDAMVE
jgi:hypothetical protein